MEKYLSKITPILSGVVDYITFALLIFGMIEVFSKDLSNKNKYLNKALMISLIAIALLISGVLYFCLEVLASICRYSEHSTIINIIFVISVFIIELAYLLSNYNKLIFKTKISLYYDNPLIYSVATLEWIEKISLVLSFKPKSKKTRNKKLNGCLEILDNLDGLEKLRWSIMIPNGDFLNIIASAGIEPQTKKNFKCYIGNDVQKKQNHGSSIAAYTMSLISKNAYYCEDITQDENYKVDRFKKPIEGVESILCIKLDFDNYTVGILSVTGKKEGLLQSQMFRNSLEKSIGPIFARFISA